MNGSPGGLADRLVGVCVGLLLAAVAVYVAVRLLESVAGALLVIGVVAGGLLLVGLAVRAWWRRQWMDRW